MKTIPQAAVDAAWDRMCEMSEAETRQLADRMQKEQPVIMAHLLAIENAEPEAHDPGWLLELGAFVWWVMTQAGKKLKPATREELDAALDKNSRELEELDPKSETEWMEGARRFIKFYDQAPLLGLVIEILISENEENPDSAEDEVGLGFLHLKTIIDCLNQ
jgi:hypothetical protein